MWAVRWKYQAPALDAEDQTKYAPTSRGPAHATTLTPRSKTPAFTPSLLDDETSANLNDFQPHDIEELADIAHDLEAEQGESDDLSFANLGEIELAAQLQSERANWTPDGAEIHLPPLSRQGSYTSTSSTDAVLIESKNQDGHSNDRNWSGVRSAPMPLPMPDNESSSDSSDDIEAKKAFHKFRKEFRAAQDLKFKNTTPSTTFLTPTHPCPPKLSKTNGTRQKNHENERPQWAEPGPNLAPPKPGPTGASIHIKPEKIDHEHLTPLATTSVAVHVKSEENHQAASSTRSSLVYPTWTALVDPQKLSLNAQHDRVKQVVKNSFIFLWAFFLWTDAYPGVTATVEYIRKSLLKAAKHVNDNEMVRRLSIDVAYNQALSPLLSGRISAWRVKPKTNAVSTITNTYGLSNDNKARTIAWLRDQCYIYPGDVGDSTKGIGQTVDGSRPYENPAILSVLEQTFFSGPSSISSRLPSKFKSSQANKPEEKEVLIPMLALVATCVYASLKERETGPRIPADFDSSVFEATYRRHVDFLGELAKRAPTKFHVLMHRIYLRVRDGQAHSVVKESEEFSSIFDISRMADE